MISDIQLEMLLERYSRQTKDLRLTEYGREVATETVSALEELRTRRVTNAILPVNGTVS